MPSNRMKIVQINSVCGYGSTGKITTDIHSVLLDSKIYSYVAYGRGSHRNIQDQYAFNFSSKAEFFNHIVNTRLFDRHGESSQKQTGELIRYIQEISPDLIHLHNIHGYYLNIQVLFDFLKDYSCPVVWTLHDCWPFTGHCAYFDYSACDRWKKQCFDCPEKNGYPKSVFLDGSRRNFEFKKSIFTTLDSVTIVTPSDWLMSLLGQSFLSEYDSVVINNGIDLSKFYPKKSKIRERLGIPSDKLMVLGVANIWERRKGLDYFIRVALEMKDEAQFVIVGLDNKQIKALSPNIIGLKRTASVDELVELYSASDVYLNTTLEDNFPTTNLEALACGTFGITFDTGGSPEAYVCDTGIIVKKGDVDSIVYNLKTLGQAFFAERSINCSEYAKSSFSHLKSAGKYLRLYNEILGIR